MTLGESLDHDQMPLHLQVQANASCSPGFLGNSKGTIPARSTRWGIHTLTQWFNTYYALLWVGSILR